MASVWCPPWYLSILWPGHWSSHKPLMVSVKRLNYLRWNQNLILSCQPEQMSILCAFPCELVNSIRVKISLIYYLLDTTRLINWYWTNVAQPKLTSIIQATLGQSQTLYYKCWESSVAMLSVDQRPECRVRLESINHICYVQTILPFDYILPLASGWI